MKNINELIIDACDESLNNIEQNDQCYVNDCLASQQAEQEYNSLELTEQQREVVDNYLMCLKLEYNTKARLYYKAGIDHAVSMIKYLEII